MHGKNYKSALRNVQ